jgi:uncharacterized membrane protein YqjE
MPGPSGKLPPTAPPGAGLLQSLRRLASTGLELVQLRLELLANDVELQKLRIFDALAWAAVGLLLLGLGLLLCAGLLVALTPEPWRPLTLALLTLGCLGGGAWMLSQARHRLTDPGGALAASRAELARDRQALAADAATDTDRPAAPPAR